MGQGVVVSAEEFEVGEGGGSTVGPMLDVVGVAPAVVPVAAGMLTVPVAGDQGSSHGGGDDPGGPSDVEGFRVGSEDDPADGAVTGIAADLVGGQDVAVGGFVDPAPMSLQCVEVGQDQDMGFFGPDASPESRKLRARSAKASARRCRAVRRSSRHGGGVAAPRAVRTRSPVTGSKQSVEFDHPLKRFGGEQVTPFLQLFGRGFGPGTIHRRLPIFEQPDGVGHRQRDWRR